MYKIIHIKIMLEDDFEKLLKNIGKSYEIQNPDGTIQGCAYPLQFLYGNRAKLKISPENFENTYQIAVKTCEKYCREIKKEDLQKGDIIITKIKNEAHCAIYKDFGKIVHIFKNHTLQIGRLKMFKEYRCFRVLE